MSLPPGTRRLFASSTDIDPYRCPEWVIEHILEDGDSEDLRWLFHTLPRAAVADWVRKYGNRRLSRRSRVAWRRLLDLELDTAESGDEEGELWPL